MQAHGGIIAIIILFVFLVGYYCGERSIRSFFIDLTKKYKEDKMSRWTKILQRNKVSFFHPYSKVFNAEHIPPDSPIVADPNEKDVKYWLRYYYDNHDVNHFSWGISKIDVFTKGNTISVTFHLSRPGLLIGKKGKQIDSLQEFLEKVLKSKVEIHIVEHSYLD